MLRADELRQCPTRFVPQRLEFINEKFDRLPFQPLLKRLLKFQHRARTTAERAVIEKNHLRIQRPEAAPADGAGEELLRDS